MGRGIFATHTIKRGEVILVEEPFVAAFIDGDRCQQCFRELEPTPEFPQPPPAITCASCGIERYCSEEYCQKAWQLYHRVQCEHAAGLKAIRDRQSTGRTTTAINAVNSPISFSVMFDLRSRSPVAGRRSFVTTDDR